MIFFCLLLNLFNLSTAWSADDNIEYMKQAEYITRSAGCRDCHAKGYTDPLSGGYALQTPFGTFYTPNITPDKETGIGEWSFSDFETALRTGQSPNGHPYYPSFPYRSFTKMSHGDLRKIYDYLMAQKPVHKKNKAHDLKFPFNERFLNYFWDGLFLNEQRSPSYEQIKVGKGAFVPLPDKSASWNRGAYLVEAVFHCAECHTPRNKMGAPKSSQWLSGSDQPIGSFIAPNLTPSSDGLGSWRKSDWQTFLSSGVKPNGQSIEEDMALVIQNTSNLTPTDRDAIIEYLINLKPISRK